MFQRTLSAVIREVADCFPVLLLTGPRQVGKTTLLEMLTTSRHRYVTLDDLNSRALAQQDPTLFVQTFKPPVIIDEIQYAPKLLSAIKIEVDRQKQKSGMYWITGSQKFSLMRGVTESLAGRVAIIDMLGFSQAEMEKRPKTPAFLPTTKWLSKARKNSLPALDTKALYHCIWQGSFPKILGMSPKQRGIYYSSYIQTYIQRDVRDMARVFDEIKFHNFITAVATRTGQLLNYADLARDVAIDNKTAKSWLSILQSGGLVYLLQPWHSNLSKRFIKTPKLYFLDTGLVSYLTKWTDPDTLSKGAMSGSILETWFFTEILKSYWHTGQTAYFYYYRDKDLREVDLLIETAESFYPVEFKKTAVPSLNAIKNFYALKNVGKKIGMGALFCLIDRDMPLSRSVMALPPSYL